jgi:hypothetical protein
MATETLCTIHPRHRAPVTVYQDTVSKRVFYTACLQVDVDGAEKAYRLDNDATKGALDDIHDSAGYPDGSWKDVLVTDPNNANKPYVDGNGFCVSMTTYQWPGYPDKTDRRNWVDAVAVPYSVAPGLVRSLCAGVLIGCKAQITRITDGAVIQTVTADLSGNSIGEASQAAAQYFSSQWTASNGDDDYNYLYEFFPDTAAVVGGVKYLLQPKN